MFTHNEDMKATKNAKFGVVWWVRGHPRSSETQPFDRPVTNFNRPHLHLSPTQGVIPFKFRHDIWYQKTRVMGLSCGVVCVIIRLAVLIQYQSVTDTHTHTHRHTTTAYTALSKASRGKNSTKVKMHTFQTGQLWR